MAQPPLCPPTLHTELSSASIDTCKAALDTNLSMTSGSGSSPIHTGSLPAILHAEEAAEELEAPELPDNNPYHLMGLASPDECCLPQGAWGQYESLSPTEEQMIELYDKLGGWELMSAAVQKLYYRLFEDPETAHYFEGKDHSKLMAHMTCFLTSGLTGRLMYTPARIYAYHADMIENMGLSVRHVDLVLDHLDEVLLELGVEHEDRQQARTCLSTARHVFAPRRQQVVARLPSGAASPWPLLTTALCGGVGLATTTQPIPIATKRSRRYSAWEPSHQPPPHLRTAVSDAVPGLGGVARSASTGCLVRLHTCLASTAVSAHNQGQGCGAVAVPVMAEGPCCPLLHTPSAGAVNVDAGQQGSKCPFARV